MLKLQDIKKDYITTYNSVHALKGINLAFPDCQFAAILGPSGGGKTTLLNIIGGLDQYTSGDFIINGKSTRKFKDKDWDSYRNHSVGFVFQNYNLIMHQSVLANVELALTLSGVSNEQRKKRAKQALIDVGLEDQINKQPNQLSGGQMQRVAIARALVNNPDILLADEPTGALDSESSVVIMDLLKEVSKDRLVIMVTHNPDLAQQYADRIIKLKDGEIVSDSKPFESKDSVGQFKSGKTFMSYATAFGLSIRNLLTKKGRTILTSIAGSIGIIGIALILSLSNGVNNYINDVQRDSLSSYPLTIETSTADMTSMITSLMKTVINTDKKEGYLTETIITGGIASNVITNDLLSFKKFMDNNPELFDGIISSTRLNYGVDLLVYKNVKDAVVQLNPSTLYENSYSAYLSISGADPFQEMIEDEELLHGQYDVVAGRWPEKYDECILVVQDPNTISDYVLYQIGVRDPAELKEMFAAVLQGKNYEVTNEPISLSYQDILNMSFKVVNPVDCYAYNETYDIWQDKRSDPKALQDVINNALDLKIVGIMCAKKGVSATSLQYGIGYRSDLTKHMISLSQQSEIVKQQLANKDVDVFSRRTFEDINKNNESKKTLELSDMISFDQKAMAEAFGSNTSQEAIAKTISSAIEKAVNISIDYDGLYQDLDKIKTSYFQNMLNSYLTSKGSSSAKYDSADILNIVACGDSKVLADIAKKNGVDSGIVSLAVNQAYGAVLQSYLDISKQLGASNASINKATIVVLTASVSVDEFKEGLKQIALASKQAALQMDIANNMAKLSTDIIQIISESMKIDPDKLANAFKFKFDENELMSLFSTFTTKDISSSAYANLNKLGYADLDDPASMAFFFDTFQDKDDFKAIVDKYNEDAKANSQESKVITYTDLTGVLMSSISTIINAISYILIAFVSISLVVSSIMIAIITYISVLERTKEIGVLRSLGASKRDVRRLFNAETFIIGLISGAFGVGLTILLNIPITFIIRKVTDISIIKVSLPSIAGAILTLISVVLTIIAGLIPSSTASKCDPVTALRSE